MKSAESGFSDFDVELEDIVVTKKKKFDRAWKVPEGGGSIHSFTAIHQGILYFGSNDRHIFAVDANSGKEIWRFKANNMFLADAVIRNKDRIFAGNCDGYFYCLDLEGKELWKFRTNGQIICCFPQFWNDLVFTGSEDGCLYAIDQNTGREAWRFKTGDWILSPPTVYGDMVMAGSGDNNLYCLEAGTGKEIWRFPSGGEFVSEHPFLAENGVLYASSLDNNLYAIDIDTGKEIWRFPTGKYGNSFGPKIRDGVLYHASRDGVLYALTLQGKEIWRFVTGKLIGGSLTFHENNLLFPCEDGNIYCLTLDGKEVKRFKTGGPIYNAPAIHKNRMYFGSWDCHVYCIGLSDWKLVWKFATTDKQETYLPPPNESWEAEIRQSSAEEDRSDEESARYAVNFLGQEVMESEYVHRSEYSSKSTYG